MNCQRRILYLLFLVMVMAFATYAQEPGRETVRLPGQEIQNIINQTYSLDAEYAIDILLKVVRSGKLPDKQIKRGLLAEAFRRIDEVQQPNRKRLILAGIDVDNRQVRLAEAFGLKLDALSLRGELLREMLKADPKEARRLAFDTGFVPAAKTLSCTDALADEFESFYEVISEIAVSSFTPAEIKEQTRSIKLQPFIESMTTLAQIAPVGRMIISIGSEKAELNQLLLAYGSAVKGMNSSGREFSGFFWSNDWIRQFMSVLKACEGKDIQCSFLKDSLRALIGKSFRTELCPDDRTTYRDHAPALIKYLNTTLLSSAPLKPEDLKFSSIGDPPKLDNYGGSGGARSIAGRYRSLNWKDPVMGGAELKNEDKLAPEWLDKLDQLFDEVGAWNGEGEDGEAAYFHQKCIFYTMLYDLAPTANLRSKVLRALGGFLANNSFKKESRIEWFLWAENYREMIGQNADLKFELLENSRDPVIQLYSALAAARL